MLTSETIRFDVGLTNSLFALSNVISNANHMAKRRRKKSSKPPRILGQRPDPFGEGSIKDIWAIWFAHWLVCKPDRMDLTDWLQLIWGTKDRDVTRYIARREFKMPGLYHTAANVKIQGIGPRTVVEGAEIWVRTDAREMDKVEVQWVEGNWERQFTLTKTEWFRIAENLELTERKGRSRIYASRAAVGTAG